jgi:UDP-N-acetylglucosamine 2-epimerase (non-hydrolysing)
MKIISVVGARPNFMKIAPIIMALNKHTDKFEHTLLHTGQHYDSSMSDVFFADLGIPKPDISLGVGSGSHAEQTGNIMIEFEKICLAMKPDLVIVVGDVNSTMACTITAKKLNIKVAHVEAGLRSRDMTMPEEINRLCTDVLCDYLYTTDHFADENLRAEGVPDEKIVFVGNVMVDTLLHHKEIAAKKETYKKIGVTAEGYATLTLHRPSNVDDKGNFIQILEALAEISTKVPIIFPIHPRTKKMAAEYNLNHFFETNNFILLDPLGYLDFLNLNINAKMILTDSGGLQEESTVLGVPCITLRENTERPITCWEGTNVIVGNSKAKILEEAFKVIEGKKTGGKIPKKWDGHAAESIVDHLLSIS